MLLGLGTPGLNHEGNLSLNLYFLKNTKNELSAYDGLILTEMSSVHILEVSILSYVDDDDLLFHVIYIHRWYEFSSHLRIISTC